MSYPSSKRRLRPARGVAALVAALLAGGTGLAAMQSALAVPAPNGPAGLIQTTGGKTISFQQGGPGTDNVLATDSQFNNPRGLNFAPNGDLYVTDALNHQVRMIDSAGVVHLVAGNGTVGYTGDKSPTASGDAKLAQLNQPHGVAVDSAGNVYIADSSNCVIRKVDTAGIITTYAGTGVKNATTGNCTHSTGSTDSGAPLSIALDQPKSIFMTKEGGVDTLYIADMGNSMIRKINVGAANPLMTRVAGTIQQKLYGGDGGPADAANLRHAEGLWVANDGTIYFTDGGNNLVRKIANDPSHTISTIAGDVATATANAMTAGQELAVHSDDGDGGQALNAHLDEPRGITGDNHGNLFIAEEHGSRVRRINMNTGVIDTIAGDGTVAEQRANGGSYIIKGENGPALQTQFNHLHDIEIDPTDANGSLWIADSRDNRIRAMYNAGGAPGAVVPTGGAVTTPPTTSGTNPVPVPGKSGYWMLGEDGKVYAFGDARSATFGDASGQIPSGAKAVHIEPTPSGKGYWINDDKGGVYPLGDAAKLGGVDASALQNNEKITSLSTTPSGAGYWLFSSKGRVFAKGDAGSFGDLAGKSLNGAIQSSIPTPSGKGYYMVGSDGGVFAFGDAAFWGSMGNVKLNKPVLSLVPTRTNKGYWLVASDGGIFAFGDAPFKGSMGSTKLNKPVVGMVRFGNGYLMVGGDGGIFAFSDKQFAGSLGDNPPARPIVFAATLDS
jgi:hypothetical protein